jgi:hypothetical protein
MTNHSTISLQNIKNSQLEIISESEEGVRLQPQYVGFQVLTAASMKLRILWDVLSFKQILSDKERWKPNAYKTYEIETGLKH